MIGFHFYYFLQVEVAASEHEAVGALVAEGEVVAEEEGLQEETMVHQNM